MLEYFLLSVCEALLVFGKQKYFKTVLEINTFFELSASAPVERCFSIAGKVFKPEGCQMKDSTFQKIMFIKCNNNLIH